MWPSTQQQASTRRLLAAPTGSVARNSLQTGQVGSTVPSQHYNRGSVSVLSPTLRRVRESAVQPALQCLRHTGVLSPNTAAAGPEPLPSEIKKEYKLENSWRNSLEIRKAKLSLLESDQQQISPRAFPPACTAQWKVSVVQTGEI